MTTQNQPDAPELTIDFGKWAINFLEQAPFIQDGWSGVDHDFMVSFLQRFAEKILAERKPQVLREMEWRENAGGHDFILVALGTNHIWGTTRLANIDLISPNYHCSTVFGTENKLAILDEAKAWCEKTVTQELQSLFTTGGKEE